MRAMRAGLGALLTLAAIVAAPVAPVHQPLIASAASCAPSVPRVSANSARLVSATNAFAFRLYDAVAGTNVAGNVFLSPASVQLALAMAYDGARGATAQGMARALGLNGMTAAAVRREAAGLLASVQSAGDPKSQLQIANSLWVKNGTPLRSRFTGDATRDFQAQVSHLDFASPSALTAINGWVACATHGAIPSILQKIPPQVVLYLLNAVYFEGKWTAQFAVADTHPRAFTAEDGQQLQVPTMDRTGLYPYYAGSGEQIAALPYGAGRFQMIVVLPGTGQSLASFRSRLTPANWQTWMAGLRPDQGEVALPRFSLTNTFQLNAPLSALGMGQAFSDSANFLGMCVRPCRLSEVRHKTFLKVDEAGTVAAGATLVGVVPTAAPIAHFHFLVNRPFFLAIRDSKTGTILFWGGINQP